LKVHCTCNSVRAVNFTAAVDARSRTEDWFDLPATVVAIASVGLHALSEHRPALTLSEHSWSSR